MASEPSQYTGLSLYQQDGNDNDNDNRNHQRSGSISLGAPPGTAGSENDGTASGAPQPSPPAAADAADTEAERQVQEVLQSEVGISTLLTRLKQSISSTKVRSLLRFPAALLRARILTVHPTIARPRSLHYSSRSGRFWRRTSRQA